MGLTTSSVHCRLHGQSSEEAPAALECELRRLMEERGLEVVEDPSGADRALFILPGGGCWLSVFDRDFEET